MNHPRPLSQVANYLLKNYGYLITYEEAPYDKGELRNDNAANGGGYWYPSSKPVTFHLKQHERRLNQTDSTTHNGLSELDKEMISAFVREHNESGNPGRFSVMFDGEYAHIIPTEQVVNGKSKPYEPILNAKIEMSEGSQGCGETLNEFFAKIQSVRGVRVVGGPFGANSLMLHKCTIEGRGLTARQVLIQMLRGMGDNGQDSPPTRFAYHLMHDTNGGDRYFLSIWPAPYEQQAAPASRINTEAMQEVQKQSNGIRTQKAKQ